MAAARTETHQCVDPVAGEADPVVDGKGRLGLERIWVDLVSPRG
jgi:hypothetical protein